jgi:hypothetical protein
MHDNRVTTVQMVTVPDYVQRARQLGTERREDLNDRRKRQRKARQTQQKSTRRRK